MKMKLKGDVGRLSDTPIFLQHKCVKSCEKGVVRYFLVVEG